MPGRGLITTGAIGALLAAICCATPLLAVVLGALGLSAWLAGADYVVLAVLLATIALIGLGLYRRNTEITSGYRRKDYRR
jgi:mercuric ion transport protein